MNVTLYWYVRDGKVRQNVFPPEDPSIPYLILTLRDIGRGITTASAVTYIQNRPVSEETFMSSDYDSTPHFRTMVEKYIKSSLVEQRGITDWIPARKKKIVKSKTKRKTGGKK
jgi:uncharacterized protein Usg